MFFSSGGIVSFGKVSKDEPLGNESFKIVLIVLFFILLLFLIVSPGMVLLLIASIDAIRNQRRASLFIVGFLIFAAASIYLLKILVMSLKNLHNFYLLRLRARKRHVLTNVPIIPEWIKCFNLTRHETNLNYVTFTYSNSLNRRYATNLIEKIRKIMKEFMEVGFISDTTYIIQIPSKNFKCGQEHWQFEPIITSIENSQFKYQMIGENDYQVTYYLESGVHYVAGVTIFIKSLNVFSINYDRQILRSLLNPPLYWPEQHLQTPHILEVFDDELKEMTIETRNEMGVIRKHRINEDGDGIKSIKITSNRTENEWKNQLNQHLKNNIKVHLCQKKNEPVIVGWKNRRMVHLEWNNAKWRTFECEKCGEENPPDYGSLEKLVDY